MGAQPTREQIGDYAVVEHELFRFFREGKRPAGLVVAAMQRLRDGKFPDDLTAELVNRAFLSPEQQLHRLQDYSRKYWNGRFLDQLDRRVFPSHTQSLEDLLVLHVEGDSPQDTVENIWWPVFAGEFPHVERPWGPHNPCHASAYQEQCSHVFSRGPHRPAQPAGALGS
jgi:hypothetical protein